MKNVDYNPDRIDRILHLAIIDKVASVYKRAAEEGYNEIWFIENFLQSNLYERIFQDYTLYSQSEAYILEVFQEELQEKNITLCKFETPHIQNLEKMYWTGYLFADWHFKENISGKEIVNTYSIEKILYSYGNLHTQAIDYAIDVIKDEFERA